MNSFQDQNCNITLQEGLEIYYQSFNPNKPSIKDDTMSEEERVEIEAVIEEHDMDALAEKLTNFLAGIGHSDKIVEIRDKEYTDASVDEEDLEDELEDINEVDNIHAFKKKHMYTDDYDGRPSDTEK